jgi:NAD(P)-dependent dehydrogenase (short-subunit alcohol dehydrogenase family)
MDRTIVGGAFSFTAAGYRNAGLKPIADRLDGRTVVITGATSGIGRHAAEWLARLGARVVLVSRDEVKLRQARAEIIATTGNKEIAIQQCELSLMAEVRALAARLIETEPRIHAVINNAGAIYSERTLTAEGFEQSHAMNLLSPFLLTELLLPTLAQSATADAPARVINVSSGGMYLQKLELDNLDYARGTYDGSKAYARAKRGQVALSVEWAEAWRARHVVVHAMHPGWVDTPGVASALPGFYRTMKRWLRTPEQGADTIVWLAASPRAAACSGNFWLDRRPHLTDILPGTTVHRDQRIQLRQSLRDQGQSKTA